MIIKTDIGGITAFKTGGIGFLNESGLFNRGLEHVRISPELPMY